MDELEERRRRGGTGKAYLVPIGDLYPDEQYIIIRGKFGVGLAAFETHFIYSEQEQETVDIKVTESCQPEVNFKIGPIRQC
jgi:hypothetical protein